MILILDTRHDRELIWENYVALAAMLRCAAHIGHSHLEAMAAQVIQTTACPPIELNGLGDQLRRNVTDLDLLTDSSPDPHSNALQECFEWLVDGLNTHDAAE